MKKCVLFNRCVLLAFLFTVTVLQAAAYGYDFFYDGIGYNLYWDDESGEMEAAVGGDNQYYNESLVIPSTVIYDDESIPVTCIGPYAFRNCAALKSVTLPNSIKRIEYGAFYSCKKLNSINIPDQTTMIGEEAFYGCIALESIIIPNSVYFIGNNTFFGCSGLKNLNIG